METVWETIYFVKSVLWACCAASICIASVAYRFSPVFLFIDQHVIALFFTPVRG